MGYGFTGYEIDTSTPGTSVFARPVEPVVYETPMLSYPLARCRCKSANYLFVYAWPSE